jgi:hypothetical protein
VNELVSSLNKNWTSVGERKQLSFIPRMIKLDFKVPNMKIIFPDLLNNHLLMLGF